MSHLFSKLAVRFLINIVKARFSSNITKHQLLMFSRESSQQCSPFTAHPPRAILACPHPKP